MLTTIRLFIFFCFVPLFSALCVFIAPAWAEEVKPVSVTASTVHPASPSGKYVPEQLLDNNPATPWVAAPGRGMNEWVEFDFGKEVTLSAIEIRNGYQKSDKSYTGNSRVQWAGLDIDGKRTNHVFDLKDVKEWQRVTLPDVRVKVLRLKIESIFRGSSSGEVALSEVRFHSGSLPAQKAEKGKAPSKNLSKEHQEFFAKLEKFSDADAALTNLEKRVSGEFGDISERERESMEYAIGVCKAMKKGLASYNNKDILDAFNGAFPYNGPTDNNSDINIALLATYAANPYFDIQWTSLNAYEGRIRAVVSCVQSFSQSIANLKTHLPPQNALEAIYYADCAKDLAWASFMYAGYAGTRETKDSLLALERDLIAGILKDASPDGRGGMELYKGWSVGMTISDAYAKISRDKLKLNLSSEVKKIYKYAPYDPKKGRVDFSTTLPLNDYDYPGRTPQKTPKGRPIPRTYLDTVMKSPEVGGVCYLGIEGNVGLLFTQSHGLFAVFKGMPGVKENRLVDELTQKYGPSIDKREMPSVETGRYPYKRVNGKLYIFMKNNGIYYVDTTAVDEFFAVWAKWWDEREDGPVQNIKDDI